MNKKQDDVGVRFSSSWIQRKQQPCKHNIGKIENNN